MEKVANNLKILAFCFNNDVFLNFWVELNFEAYFNMVSVPKRALFPFPYFAYAHILVDTTLTKNPG